MTTPAIVKRYSPRGAALDVFHERSPEVLLVGAAGTGKSRAALEKLHTTCLLVDNVRVLIVRKTLVSLAATGLITYREHVANDALAAGVVQWYGGSNSQPPAFRYSNGSTITVGGMDKPDKIMSSEFDLAFVQEATDCTIEDWEKIITRLRNGRLSYQQILGDANPQNPSHWLKKRCDEGTTKLLTSLHEDNPVLFDDDRQLTERGRAYMKALDSLTGVRYLRLRKGIWAAAEGIIYDEWRPELHLSDRKQLPREWQRIWSIDFGFVHPFVWQMWAIDPDGRMWLEKEIHMTKKLVEDHAKEILSVVTMKDGVTWKYPKPRAIICDHDAEDRATLERHLGLGTVAATKTVSDGIQAVAARLRVQGDGKPRLFVLRDSLVRRDEEASGAGKPVNFAQEVEGYVWAMTADGKPDKDEPVKDLDDSMDCARYAVAHQDLAARGVVRWL